MKKTNESLKGYYIKKDDYEVEYVFGSKEMLWDFIEAVVNMAKIDFSYPEILTAHIFQEVTDFDSYYFLERRLSD